jgi:hypothetical protein
MWQDGAITKRNFGAMLFGRICKQKFGIFKRPKNISKLTNLLNTLEMNWSILGGNHSIQNHKINWVQVLCRPKNFGRHSVNSKKKCNPYFIVIMIRGKVKTKHDITWFAQRTNVDQLNSAYVHDSGGVNNFLLFTL